MRVLFFVLLLVFTSSCSSNYKVHDPKDILDKINERVTLLNSGSYTLHSRYTKISIGEDSSTRDRVFNVKFKKSGEAILGFKVLSRGNGIERMYDSKRLYINMLKDSTLYFNNSDDARNPLLSWSSDYTIIPFQVYKNRQFQSMNTKTKIKDVSIVGVEMWHNMLCYKIQLGKSQGLGNSKAEVFSYVLVKDLLPVGQYIMFETIENNVKKIEIFDEYLDNIEFGSVNDAQFDVDNLSYYVRQKENIATVYDSKNTLLEIGSHAPEWTLPGLDGKNLSLPSFRGKVVVLDFWFKECPPCLKQMVELQQLHNTFSNRLISFVGINIKDDPIKDNLSAFLNNRKVTMLTVYNGSLIQDEYKISSAPVLYIIGKSGEILYRQDGYSEKMIERVSEVLNEVK